jgi:ATP-dependent helicase/nuclease subunit B
MLKIITSLCGKKRLEYLTAKLTASDSAVLVVPEQFLFESERGMYRLLGARKIAITEITGLSKLAADLLKKHGEPKLYADDIVKIVTMYKTLRRLSRSRRGEDAAPYVYTSVTFDSAKRFLDIIADLKSADISPALLKDSLLPNEENPDNNKQESGLADKLRSISEIYEAYSAFLNADEFADKLDDISRAADLIDSLDLLRGKEVFLYEFDGFSASQIKLIRAVSESADSVTILLRTDAEMSEVPEFRAVNTLISRLKRDIPFEVEVLGGESYSPRVELWQSDNVRGESEFVAAEIRKLITENGYICNDIAVLTCGGSPADSTRLKQSLNEYDIACYTDLPEPIIAKSMTRFVLTALEAVGLDTPKLLSYIRSGYVRVRYDLENDDTVRNLRLASPDEVRLKGSNKKYAFDKGGSRLTRRLSKRSMDLLERTAFRYALTRREWGKSFPKTSADLRRVEPLRNDIVRPLLDLKASCENKDGSEITEILCRFLLDTMQLQKTVLGLCEQTQSDFENKSLAEEFRQLWDLIIDVFESLYAALKGEQLTLGEYTELLRGVFSSVNIAKPPQVLDAVVIGDLSRSRMSDIKIVFVTGAVSGKFPKSCAVAGGGIFTGRELESLSERGLELSSNLQQRYDFDRLVVNKTLTLPSGKL